MGPTRGPPGSCRPQMGPKLVPWTLLSGYIEAKPRMCLRLCVLEFLVIPKCRVVNPDYIQACLCGSLLINGVILDSVDRLVLNIAELHRVLEVIGWREWVAANASKEGILDFCEHYWKVRCRYPDSKVHGANMGSIWGRQDPGGPRVGPMNFAIWVVLHYGEVTWALWRLKSQRVWLIVQELVEVFSNESITAPHNWNFVKVIHRSPVDSIHKRTVMRSAFWYDAILTLNKPEPCASCGLERS